MWGALHKASHFNPRHFSDQKRQSVDRLPDSDLCRPEAAGLQATRRFLQLGAHKARIDSALRVVIRQNAHWQGLIFGVDHVLFLSLAM